MAAFKEGRDKHSIKREGQGQYMVFSYGSKFQLLDRINDFCKYLPSEVKNITQITPEHLASYLDAKAEYCSQRTLDEYRSELRKLGNIFGVRWDPDKVTALQNVVTNRGAKDVISKEDWTKVYDYVSNNLNVTSHCVIALEKHLGVRVGDACYGIHDCGDKLVINSKNGKKLEVVVTTELREFLSKPEVQKHFRDDVFKPCKDASVNRQLRAIEDRLGLERHSFHSIRRRLAQDRYDALRMAGVSKSEALSVVSKSLNHGERRDAMLTASYIANIW